MKLPPPTEPEGEDIFVLKDALKRVKRARQILEDAKGDPEKGEDVIKALQGLDPHKPRG
jgi:hypothetical protein